MTAAPVSKGRVHFECEDRVPRDNAIVIKQNSPGYVQVHLGFLQYQHKYSITLKIPKGYFLGYSLQSILEAAEQSLPNVNCKVVSIQEKKEVYEVVVEFHATKEKLMKEELKFCLKENVKMKIEFSARVLGPGKGTPLLKNEIKCISVGRDDLSEASDWQD